MILEEPLSELPLSSNTTPDGKKIITLEDFLGMELRHPTNSQDVRRLTATEVPEGYRIALRGTVRGETRKQMA